MKKMSFSNIKDVLSRDEMKMIMAGSGVGNVPKCTVSCHDNEEQQEVEL